MNTCVFSGTIATRPEVAIIDGVRTMTFDIVIDETEYDRETRSYDEVAVIAGCVMRGDAKLRVMSRLLHVGTYVCVSSHMRTMVGRVDGTDVTFPRSVFVIDRIDIGRQPRRVDDDTWMERERA